MVLDTAKRAYVDACVILVDTREQTPWVFSGHETERVKLAVGDYSIRGGDLISWGPGQYQAIAIERKSINDLVGSLSSGRDRFKREFVRANDLEVRMHLVIEADIKDVVDHRYRSKMTPASVIQSLVAWQQQHGFFIWWASNRPIAARLCESILEKHVTGFLVGGQNEIKKG